MVAAVDSTSDSAAEFAARPAGFVTPHSHNRRKAEGQGMRPQGLAGHVGEKPR